MSGCFACLRRGRSKVSAGIGEGRASLFRGKKVMEEDLLAEVVARLLGAGVGVEATSASVQNLTQEGAR